MKSTRLADHYCALLRKKSGAMVVDNFYRLAARAAGFLPQAAPERYGVERIVNLDYADSRLVDHRLDLYLPRKVTPPWPVVFYSHGGGFRVLSKDTHWLMGLAFARRGFLVVNVNYRLAPAHPFPAAHEDVARAYVWMTKHIQEFGGDLDRVVVAGESAGANLALSLAIMATSQRPEPFAQAVFATQVVPQAAVVNCGILQVSDTMRFARRKKLSGWVDDRLTEVEEAYLGQTRYGNQPGSLALADPLVILETQKAPERPFPRVFAPVGTRDPLLDDTRRLKAVLDRLEVPCRAAYYPGQVHAFFAYPFLPEARRCWRDIYDFLSESQPT